jgi:hypothetical protein
MKKIVWIFGQPGSGRKTLVKNILNNNEEVKSLLNLTYSSVLALDDTNNKTFNSYEFRNIELRREYILEAISKFVDSTTELLVVYGEFNDFSDSKFDLLKQIAEDYPDLDKEILFLNPSDIDIYHKRLKNTEWFKSNEKENLFRFPKDWLRFSTNYMKENLYEYKKVGYKITEIDTLDGYKINKPKMLELKQD